MGINNFSIVILNQSIKHIDVRATENQETGFSNK